MAKYKRTIRGGRYCFTYTYSRIQRNDSPKARAEKQRCSSQAQQEVNKKFSRIQLSCIIAENFADSPTAMFVTVSFDDAHYPKLSKPSEYRAYVEKEADKYLDRLKYLAKKRGSTIKCVWAHGIGEEGRHHEHLVVDGVSWEDLRACWGRGNVDFHYLYSDHSWLKDRGWLAAGGNVNSAQIAAYLMGNGNEKRPVGKHPWHATRNLARPKFSPAQIVPDSEPIDPSEDAEILDKLTVASVYGQSQYVEYITVKPATCKRRRAAARPHIQAPVRE